MPVSLVWFRRDLRHYDHAALYYALQASRRVYCAFVFDRRILDALKTRIDRRVAFIHQSVQELDRLLNEMSCEAGGAGSGLIVRYGWAEEEIPLLAQQLGANRVYANRDYEPAALERDDIVAQRLGQSGVQFCTFKDQVVFECDEILTVTGRPFSVFTPYSRAWRKRLEEVHVPAYAVAHYGNRLASRVAGERIPALAEMGFESVDLEALAVSTGVSGGYKEWDDFRFRIDAYEKTRDFPALRGTSGLSVHLRFGTVSVRELVAFAWKQGGAGAETWLNELIWRDFYQMILWHRPEVVSAAFRPEFDRVCWDDAPEAFSAWCEGRTGYPLVDAAMRQLIETGWMHNRLRMVVASFLTKDLGIDWRRGERYFAELLNDYDLAANNGGWQWAASCGCDAQPYFRIFNPVTQSMRFDPEGRFIRHFLPVLERVPDRFIHSPWKMGPIDEIAAGVKIGADYPAPIVDHAQARERTLARFAVIKR